MSCRRRPSVVAARHHATVGARVADEEDIALGAWGQLTGVAEHVPGLTDGAHDVCPECADRRDD